MTTCDGTHHCSYCGVLVPEVALENEQALHWRLRTARAARGLTQQEVASRASIPLKFIVDIEEGKLKPNVDIVYDIAKAMAVSVDFLMGRDDELGTSYDSTLIQRVHNLPPYKQEFIREVLQGVYKLYYPKEAL